MTVHYIYHSCFAVTTETALIVFDYWQDSDDGMLHRLIAGRGDRRLYFVVSHFHEDHYNAEILDFADARLLVSYDTARRRHIASDRATAVLRPGQVYEDECLSLRAVRSTDVGISSLVTLPDGTRLYHAGDNNNWYFPQDPGEHIHCSLKEMEGLFLSTVREVKGLAQNVDYVMFPVDPRLGDEILRGPRQWLKAIKTGHFYPMHCWEQWDAVGKAIEQLIVEFPKVEFVSLP